MKKRSREVTKRLSVYEQNVLLPILIKGLKMKKGKMNAVANKEIVQGLRDHGVKVTEREVYRLINHIRTNDLVVGLVTSSTGYYITNSERDFIMYEGSLQIREAALKEVRMSIQRQRRKLFAPIQSQLF